MELGIQVRVQFFRNFLKKISGCGTSCKNQTLFWFSFYYPELETSNSNPPNLGTHIFGNLAFTPMALCCLVQFPSFILSMILQLNPGIRGTHLYRMHTNEPFSWHYRPCFTMAHCSLGHPPPWLL